VVANGPAAYLPGGSRQEIVAVKVVTGRRGVLRK
jgi:hypothetical protein